MRTFAFAPALLVSTILFHAGTAVSAGTATATATTPAAGTAPAAKAPALPGARIEQLASGTANLTPDDDPAPPEPCLWCVRERATRWAPAVGLGAAAAAVGLAAEPPRHPRWDTRNSFDDAIQDGLAGDSASTRNGAATASGVLLGVLGAALSTDIYLLRDEYPVEQSLMVGLTATAADMLATETAKVSAGRERPYVRPCRANPGYTDSCNSGRDDNGSFFSAHASASATLAGLLCARRLSRAKVTWADRLICGGAAAAAVTTGILRVTAEEHYFTDVLAGWGSGVLFGAVLPIMLPQWSGIGDAGATHAITPLAVGDGVGLEYTTVF